jgi:putative ABC transport system permease protein
VLLSYLKLSLRLLVRNPFFTTINVLGLSVGFAVFLVLWQYSQEQLNTDRQWKDWDRIARITFRYTNADNVFRFGSHSAEFIRRAGENVKEFEDFTRIINFGNWLNQSLPHRNQIYLFHTKHSGEQVSYNETKLAYADPNFFEFFGISLIVGDPQQILQQPNSVAISERATSRYFGDEVPLGKVLMINDTIPLMVTGVFKSLPQNTHLDLEFVVSTKTIEKYISPPFTWALTHGYFRVRQETNLSEAEASLNYYFEDINKSLFLRGCCNGLGDIKLLLQPLEDIAFTQFRNDRHQPKSKFLMVTFSLISIVILVMAWVNYVNLSLSMGLKRRKELAARKAVGAKARDIFGQFLVEACVVNVLSILVAITLVQIFRQPLEVLCNFHFGKWKDTSLQTLLLVGIVIITGILVTGTHPAWSALRSSPKALFGSLGAPGSNKTLIHHLSVFQYVVAIVLVTWVGHAYLQINFILTKDIGLQKDGVVVADLPFQQNAETQLQLTDFRNRLRSVPGVSDITFCGNLIGDPNISQFSFRSRHIDHNVSLRTNGGVDERFIQFFGIKLIAGRDFVSDAESNRKAVILNRSATRQLGYETIEAALGEELTVPPSGGVRAYEKAHVIGVIEDYSFNPFLQEYEDIPAGLALTYKNYLDTVSMFWKAVVKVKSPDVIEQIGREYRAAIPHSVFTWTFLDDRIRRAYRNEEIGRNQLLVFSLIAIGIACLGLFGMISHKVRERTKEIGIRKVLGATLHHISQLLLSTTMKQIVIGALVGMPLAFVLTQQYLQRFSERIVVQWWHFALPIMLLIMILLITVLSVILKAANSNPVEALKYE